MAANSSRYLSDLYKQINQRFDLEEVRGLCFDLGVDFDNIAGEGKSARIRELILQLARRDELQSLVNLARQARPTGNWADVPADFSLPGGLETPGTQTPTNVNPHPRVIFDQSGQTVHKQFIFTEDAHIDHIGDNITVGNISGSSGVAIGRGASASVSTTTSGSTVGDGPLFARLQALVTQQSPELAGKVAELQTQVNRGASADDNTVAGLIDDLARGVPGAGEALKALMGSPEAAVAASGPATKFILSRLS